MTSRLLSLLATFILVVVPSTAQLSLVTFLHNSPEPTLRVADIYVTQAGSTTKIDGLDFQKANNLNSIAIFGDLEVSFALAPGGSFNASEAIVEHKFTPSPDKGYMVIAYGVKTPASYVVNPDGKSTKLAIKSFAVDGSVVDPNKTGMYFAHGCTDLEVGDFWIRGGTKAAALGLAFLDNTTTPFAAENKTSTIDFTKKNDKTKILASFSVDIASLSSAVVVSVLSGFKTPNDNAASTDTLSLLSVLENGNVVKSPLLAGSQTSKVQLVHVAADPALTTVDIWINGAKAFENVSYSKATGYSLLPANTPIVIGFAPATSTAYKDTIRTVQIAPLRPGRSYSLIATGVVDSSKFTRNPDGRDIVLNISVNEGALEQSPETNKTAIRVGHFSTDSKRITIANNSVVFGSRLGYTDVGPEYTLITPAMDTLWVLDSANIKVKGYACDLRGVNKAFLVLAVGFSLPDSNMKVPAFKLILVETNGTVNSSLIEVDPSATSVNEDAKPTSAWIMGPNPVREEFFLSVPAQDGYGEDWTAELVGITGNVLATVRLTHEGAIYNGLMPLSAVASGSYRVRVVSANGTVIGSKGLVVSR